MKAKQAWSEISQLYERRHEVVANKIRVHLLAAYEGEVTLRRVLLDNGLDITLFENVRWNSGIHEERGKFFLEKTPDISVVTMVEGRLRLDVVEVSVSTKVMESRAIKDNKYRKGLELIGETFDIDMNYLVVSSFTDGRNLDTEYPGIDWSVSVEEIRLINERVRLIQTEEIEENEKAMLTAMMKGYFSKGKSRRDTRPSRVIAPQRSDQPEFENDEEVLFELKDFAANDLERTSNFQRVSVAGIKETIENASLIASSSFVEKEHSGVYAYMPFGRAKAERPMTMEYQKTCMLEAEREFSYINERDEFLEAMMVTLEKGVAVGAENWDLWFRKTMDGREPMTVTGVEGRLSTRAKELLQHWTGKDRTSQNFEPKLMESLPFWNDSINDNCYIDVLKIKKRLEMDLEEEFSTEKIDFGNSMAEASLSNVFHAEMKRRVIDPVARSRAFQSSIVVRDVCEWLVAQSGNKRSKRWSVFACCDGECVIIKIPGKSTESLGGKINYMAMCTESAYLGPQTNVMRRYVGKGKTWLLLKPMSLDLRRLESMGSTLEKGLLLCGSIATKHSEATGTLPSPYDLREIFSIHYLVSTTPKNRICSIFDYLRYAINSCVADVSGYGELLKDEFSKACGTSLEVFLRREAASLLEDLAENKDDTLVKKMTLGQHSIKTKFGATGKYRSFSSNLYYKSFSSLHMEIYGLFFTCPKGLHGKIEDLKIQEETVEWQAKWDALAKQLKCEMQEGYTIGDREPRQQTFCRDFMYECGRWIDKQVSYKWDDVQASIQRGGLRENYYANPRNRSTKGMTVFSSDYSKMESTTTIQQALRELAGGTTVGTVEEEAMKSVGKTPNVRLVRKYQRTTSDRGIFVADRDTRAKLQVIERIAGAIAKNVESELISVPGDVKMNIIQDMLTKAIRWSAGESVLRTEFGDMKMKRRVMFCSADATKWSPGDNAYKFIPFVEGITSLTDAEKNLLTACLLGISKSNLGLSDGAFEMLSKMDGTKNPKVDEMKNFFGLPYRRTGKVEGNWLQGNLNFISSLVGVAALNKGGGYAKKLWPELDCFVEVLGHSDDSLILIGWVSPASEDIGQYLLWVDKMAELSEEYKCLKRLNHWECIFRVIERTALMASIKLSTKKTFLSKTMSEFVGYNFEAGNPTTPWIKPAMGALGELKVKGYAEDRASVMSSAVKVLDLSGSLQMAQLVAYIGNGRVLRGYGMQKGMVNHPGALLKLRDVDIPSFLGGGPIPSVLSLATGGTNLQDIMTVKAHVTRYRTHRDTYSERVLKVYKTCEKLFKEEENDQHIFGRVKWRIFFPKSDPYELGFLTRESLKAWEAAHPEFFFLNPTDPKDILFQTWREFRKPEMQASLVRQSETVLRMRLMGRVAGDVVWVNGEWASVRTLLFTVSTQCESELITESDLIRWEQIEENLFSKSIVWTDFLNQTFAEVSKGVKRQVAKLPRRLVVREDDIPLINQKRDILAWGVSSQTTKRLIETQCTDPNMIEVDAAKLRAAAADKLQLDITLVDGAKRCDFLTKGSTVSRTVIVGSNVEPTATGIVIGWLRESSFTRVVSASSSGYISKAKTIFSENTEGQHWLNAKKLIITIWKMAKANSAEPGVWLRSLSFQGATLWKWMQTIVKQTPDSSRVDAALAVALNDTLGDDSWLNSVASQKMLSGKRYVKEQHYDPVLKVWQGQLVVEFLYGSEIGELYFDGDSIVKLSTSIRDPIPLTHMMNTVRKELAGSKFNMPVVRSDGTEGIRVIKRKDFYRWDRVREGDWILPFVFIDPTMSVGSAPTRSYQFTIRDGGFSVWAKDRENSRGVKIASAMSFLSDIPLSALEAADELFHQNVAIHELTKRGFLPNLILGTTARITRSEAAVILVRKTLPKRMAVISEVLDLVGGGKVSFHGIEFTKTSISSWETAEDESDDDYVVDLDDMDFDLELEEPESSFGTVEVNAEFYIEEDRAIENEDEIPRGVTIYEDLESTIRHWVEKDVGDVSNVDGIQSFLFMKWLAKSFDFGRQVDLAMYWDLLSVDTILGPMANTIDLIGMDVLKSKLKEAPEMRELEPSELKPYLGFNYSRAMRLMANLFPRKRVDFYD
ncbi:L protein [Wenling red spikefish hantavirus]|uniref:RNA-directed RNA polymerase L n=1 Tax=Wenling red spikefish hantavirus TaxID=2116435 RepID=A0A2P1GNS4_9VIRU|nr:L protein [Wenling red spikefish hantavirus]AVM87662.1 L protein [Wenling red spikefish hantavirus]